MANTDAPQRPSQFERHLQTGLSSVAVAGVLGIGAIVWGIPAQNATVNVKLEQMQLDIADLKKGVGDRYTRTDADRDRGQYERRFRALERRMRAVPVDSRSDPKVAEIIGDHFRYIENRSNARYAYTRAADRQVIAGIGHWRVTTEYSDDTTFDQEILIEAIDGQVLWDPDAIAPTREDALYCFVYVDMPRDSPDFTNLKRAIGTSTRKRSRTCL